MARSAEGYLPPSSGGRERAPACGSAPRPSRRPRAASPRRECAGRGESWLLPPVVLPLRQGSGQRVDNLVLIIGIGQGSSRGRIATYERSDLDCDGGTGKTVHRLQRGPAGGAGAGPGAER